MGRQLAEKKDVILESLRQGAPRLAALRAAGYSKSAFYRHLESDPDFKEEVEDAETEAIDKVENRLYQLALHGQGRAGLTAAIFYLKCKRPEQFTEMTRHEFRGFLESQQRSPEEIETVLKQYEALVVEFETTPAQGLETKALEGEVVEEEENEAD